ncbi:MAG: L-2-amino-thiazoline-4-carboxylic acid hydrolase [Rhizobiales bacterium]|nr:L-2-amino-thiazoline-4-carboxylic acid hydrolase [Hyphomicrobiales bacterium]MBI3672928.1 L-2-amino-thiazoline-4-carboxylic acid hydrolase [Hyphomicrobiales bacterium]
MSEELPVLLKRRLQAQVIGPIHAEMVAAIGKEKADAILDAAVRKAAIAEGKSFAAKAPGGVTSLAGFIKLYELWMKDGALEVEVLEASDTVFDFDVTRCKYAETYKEMGLGHIGHLMSCNRDGTFCQGYDPKITLERRHTIMAGAARCTFRYRRSE